jgi:hypothetical protein
MTVILIKKNRYDFFGFASIKIRVMAELTAKLFRDYFSGRWSGKIIKNGEFSAKSNSTGPKLLGSLPGTQNRALSTN